MRFKERIKKLLCNHEWEKFMGFRNIGRGKFAQKYICKKCGKAKEVIR